jgi:hypothetical protein
MKNLKNLVLDNVLTTNDMRLVKGGVSVNASAMGLARANSVVTSSSDDKRRERPGGGVTN